MKVLLFGATGNIGRAIAAELAARGHRVTGVTRSAAAPAGSAVPLVAGDVADAEQVAVLARGHDVVASAVGPRIGADDDRTVIVGAAEGLVAGLRKAGVRRLVVLGGAGSLRTADGTRVVDDPHFPDLWKANALAQIEALDLYREADDLDWTYISPAKLIEPGERTGVYRISGDDLLVDAAGQTRISIPDYAVAFVDQLEGGQALRTRVSVAY